MTSVLVTPNSQQWRYWPEPTPPRASRFQVIASAQLIDELTGEPPHTPVRVTSPDQGVTARASIGGLVGLVGRPAALYPDPWPGVSPTLTMMVEASGYLPLELTASLPPQPLFPDQFTSLDLGAIGLHREPTRLNGRATEVMGAPAVGATVAVTAIWATTAGILGAGAAPDGVSLLTPLSADRLAGAVVRHQPLALLAGAKTLLEPAAAGAVRLKLSDRMGLAFNQPVAIEPGDPERAEYIGLFDIEADSSPDQAAWVTLHHPLHRMHPAGVRIVPTAPAAPGPNNLLTRPARRGDRTLLLNGLAGLAPNQLTVEVSGGGAPEYHVFSLWQATTAPNGVYRLPPLHRLAHVELTASGGGQPFPTKRIVSLTGWPDAIADLVFP